ncbi:MAG TPA: TetR/AcrR family transcriptional regulator [Dehalococcoidia bacterium]|nr:TetR/AcrR family transcriptional regulator [Dehalococcoidia bacterium]
MPKLKPEEIALRRREIVEAARRCFIRSGFHQTTTDEICREANITPGGLYHYFSNKEELIKAVVRYAADSALQVMQDTATGTPEPRVTLRKVGEFFIRGLYERDFENVARLDLETWSEAMRNGDLLRIIHEGRAATRNSVAQVIRDAIGRGEYSDQVDPVALANLFVAIFTGLRLSKLLGPNDVDPDKVLDALRVLVRGELLSKPDAPPAEGSAPRPAARTS